MRSNAESMSCILSEDGDAILQVIEIICGRVIKFTKSWGSTACLMRWVVCLWSAHGQCLAVRSRLALGGFRYGTKKVDVGRGGGK